MYLCGGLLVVLLLVVFFAGESTSNRCITDDQCDFNQVCYQSKCKCQMGFQGIPNGFGVDCYEKFCSNRNDECTRTFGNSGCSFDDGTPLCVCDKDYVWNPNSERCEFRKVSPPSCVTKAHCGINSVCYKGKCRCELGYVWRMIPTRDGGLFKQICVRKLCNYDSDCSEVFPNSQCGSSGKRCVCNNKFQLDRSSQSCLPKKPKKT